MKFKSISGRKLLNLEEKKEEFLTRVFPVVVRRNLKESLMKAISDIIENKTCMGGSCDLCVFEMGDLTECFNVKGFGFRDFRKYLENGDFESYNTIVEFLEYVRQVVKNDGIAEIRFEF